MNIPIPSVPDVITVEVIGRRFTAASEEMFATLVRSSFSPNIRERRDCSVGIFDVNGNLIALSAIGPIHLSSLMGVVQNVRQRFALADLKTGDCLMTNDPYVGGGSHLPDITIITPVIYEGEVVAFVANLAHHSDIGGRVPGSESADCTSIFQEGLRIPIVHLVAGGELQRDVFDFLMLNSRTPRERDGDIKAQIAANNVGVERVQAIFKKFGYPRVIPSLAALLDHADARTKDALRRIPNGIYESEQLLDNDGLVNCEIPMKLALTVEDERIIFDLTGTSEQVAGARNMPYTATLAGVYYAIKALLEPDLPVNSGAFRCVEVIAPEGCLFNPVSPAAVGDRAATGNILGDLIFAAMAKADSSRVMAGCGPYHGVIMSGWDPRDEEYFVDYETFAGASGALDGLDGRDAVRVHVSGSANLPIESLEQEYPMAVLCYELVTDTGGAGQWRGGLSTRRDIAVFGNEVLASARGLRQHVPAFGLFGGQKGKTGKFALTTISQEEKALEGSFSELPVESSSILTVVTPSGGGFGAPFKRDPNAVLSDVVDGKVSVDSAAKVYGVVVAGGNIDEAGTRNLRSATSAGIATGMRN